MERYIVLDIENLTIWETSDLKDENSGGSVACSDLDDFKHELKETMELYIERIQDKKLFDEYGRV